MATRKAKAKPKVKAKPKTKATVRAKPKVKAKSGAALSQKAQELGLAALSQAERDVYLLSDLRTRVAESGLGGFLEHAFGAGGESEWRGRDIVLAIQALRRAERTRYAELLDRALRILLRPARAGAVFWDDFIASVDTKDELPGLALEAAKLNRALA